MALQTTRIIYTLLFFFISLSGCASQKQSIIQKSIWEDTSNILKDYQGKAQNLNPRQIRKLLIENNSNLDSFRAKAEIRLASPELKAPLSCTGLIVYKYPQNLRAICSKFITTVFDISTDGDTFRLYIPSEKTVYTGTCDVLRKKPTLGINIFPEDMANLFNYKDMIKEGKIALEIWPKYWIVHTLESNNGKINVTGKFLVDRFNADTFRYEMFNPDGSIRLQAVLTNYSDCEERRLPQRIDIRWPEYDTIIGITFSKIEVNKSVDPKIFKPRQPDGAKLIYLNN